MPTQLPGMFSFPETPPSYLRPVPALVLESDEYNPLAAFLKVGGWKLEDITTSRRVFVEVKTVLDMLEKSQHVAERRKRENVSDTEAWWRHQGLSVDESA